MSLSVLRLEEKVDDHSFNYKEWIQKERIDLFGAKFIFLQN